MPSSEQFTDPAEGVPAGVRAGAAKGWQIFPLRSVIVSRGGRVELERATNR